MNAIDKISASDRYERCVETSKRVRWDIEKDVIRGRRFDTTHKFLPDGLSLADAFTTLSAGEKRFVSQIQGRTYANIFGLVERFINAKVLELSHDHWLDGELPSSYTLIAKPLLSIFPTPEIILNRFKHHSEPPTTKTPIGQQLAEFLLNLRIIWPISARTRLAS
jgi:hypothetical protein